VKLIIKGERANLILLYSQGNEEPKELTRVMARYLSSETVGGFTGVFIGLYATGNGIACKANADYDWFEYARNTTQGKD
jgi:alpha-N-arabinofuranosidase